MKKDINLSSYLRYGGASRKDFQNIERLMNRANLLSWRILTFILEFLFLATFVASLINLNLRPLAPYYGALALYDLFLIFIFFFALDEKRNSKILYTLIYISISVFLIMIFISIWAVRSEESTVIHVLFFTVLLLSSVFSLDQPYKLLILILVASITFLFGSLILNSMMPGGAYKSFIHSLDLILTFSFFLATSSISLFINITRINNLTMLYKVEQERDVDALTGVRNYLAYERVVEKLSVMIAEKQDLEFAVAIFDINDLKLMNDNYGHKCGDELICHASKIICDAFKHSPVYRVGGDEFVAILFDEDYNNRDYIAHLLNDELSDLHDRAKDPLQDVSFAFGIAKYQKGEDLDYASVFRKADRNMYENKRMTKLRRYIE